MFTVLVCADLVQGSTAKVEILEHMVRIPIETKSHPFWQRDPFDGHNERNPGFLCLISCPFACASRSAIELR